jgi:hypothetical protein
MPYIAIYIVMRIHIYIINTYVYIRMKMYHVIANKQIRKVKELFKCLSSPPEKNIVIIANIV